MTRLFGSVDYFAESTNDITWAAQFLTPEDQARADYAGLLQAGAGMPAEHNDPHNPSPMWRYGAVVNRALFELARKEGFDWTKNLKSFAPTVLFLSGDLNEARGLWYEEEQASSFASAQIIRMQNVGHEMIWERPAEYLEHVRTYFQQIGFTGGVR